MKRLHQLFTAAMVAGALQGCATPPASTSSDGVGLKQEETAIPFFNSQRSAVTGWQADGLEGLWIEGSHREWYYAKLNGPCFGLDNAIRLGFDTGPSDRLDRFSQPANCPIISFTKSDPPPDGKRHTFEDAKTK
jgi:hypothetical protein